MPFDHFQRQITVGFLALACMSKASTEKGPTLGRLWFHYSMIYSLKVGSCPNLDKSV